tara:strand:+ start:698 stop:922 length:225 start_codon:yes stop_codon:yes gene_type:complete
MAIKKHAMTKEGAIVAITRKQVKDINKKQSKKNDPAYFGIRKTFIDLYMSQSDEQIKETYLIEFGIELEIVKER